MFTYVDTYCGVFGEDNTTSNTLFFCSDECPHKGVKTIEKLMKDRSANRGSLFTVTSLLHTTSVTMTPTVSSRESSCLANHSPLHVSVQCCRFLYSLFKKLAFMPVASAMTAVCSDHQVLASNAPWTELQQLVSWGQISFR